MRRRSAKWLIAGVVLLVVGWAAGGGRSWGGPGSTDGTGAAARFNDPVAVATDSSNHVYVADTDNSTIRKITPRGAVTTFAGTAGVDGHSDGNGAAASFDSLFGVAVDGAGNVYVADTGNNTIRKITPNRVVTTLAGTAGDFGSVDGVGAEARFDTPYGVAADRSGNVYVADTGNNTIRKITPAGLVTTIAGDSDISGSADGMGGAAKFNAPLGIATDRASNVYVADTGNDTIRKIAPNGMVTTVAGAAGVNGHADGTGAAATFDHPYGLATDKAGNIYVADNGNDTIRKITPSRVVTTLAGTVGIADYADGTGTAARFNDPSGVAVDNSGNVYVADPRNFTIRKITPGGVVTTFAGSAGPP